MSGIDQKDVEHHFNLDGAKAGDTFLGCFKCGNQYPFNHVANPVCDHCRGPMHICTVRPVDIERREKRR